MQNKERMSQLEEEECKQVGCSVHSRTPCSVWAHPSLASMHCRDPPPTKPRTEDQQAARRVLGDATKEWRVTTVQRDAVLQALEQRRSVLLAHLAGHRLYSQTCAACGRDMLFPAGLRSDGFAVQGQRRLSSSGRRSSRHTCSSRPPRCLSVLQTWDCSLSGSWQLGKKKGLGRWALPARGYSRDN